MTPGATLLLLLSSAASSPALVPRMIVATPRVKAARVDPSRTLVKDR